MKELNRTTRLVIAAIAAILFLTIGYLTMYRPNLVYKLKPEEIASKACNPVRLMSPEVLKSIISQKDSKTVIVDVRNTDEFSKGHLDKAVNIPVRNLLDRKNIDKIKELSKSHTMIVFYGNDQLQASSPCLILQQLGVDNVKILQGGYSFFTHPPADSLYKGQAAPYFSEVPRIDTSVLKKSTPASSETGKNAKDNKKPEVLKPVKKAGGAGGGC